MNTELTHSFTTLGRQHRSSQISMLFMVFYLTAPLRSNRYPESFCHFKHSSALNGILFHSNHRKSYSSQIIVPCKLQINSCRVYFHILTSGFQHLHCVVFLLLILRDFTMQVALLVVSASLVQACENNCSTSCNYQVQFCTSSQ